MATETTTRKQSSFSALVNVIEKCVLGMDQKLGYPGRERYVIFYFEPRGEEVIWRDSRSYGFSTGAFNLFKEELAPVAEMYGVELGNEVALARDVLLIDRAEHRAYFVERGEALHFLELLAKGGHAGLLESCADTLVPNPTPPVPKSQEVTQETIAKLAYDIWERKGRMEGHYLDDWLEAETQLAAQRQRAGASQRKSR